MVKDSFTLSSNPNAQQPDRITIRQLMLIFVSNWYVFVISIVVAGLLAFTYGKLAIPIYRVTASILVEDANNAGVTGIENNLLQGFGVRSGSHNMDNQILILSSWAMIQKSLVGLNFETNIYRKSLSKQASYYPMSPIEIIPGYRGMSKTRLEFQFKYLEENKFRLKTKGNSNFHLDTIVAFGQNIQFANGSFTIMPHPDFEDLIKPGDKLYFKHYNQEDLTAYYQARLLVQKATRDGTIIRLSLEGPNKAKDIVFLERLTEIFSSSNLEKKNHEANRVVEFIDAQLVNVSDSLMLTENQLQDFRSRNRIMNVSAQAQQIIDQALTLENEKARLQLEKNYYEYLHEYLTKEDINEALISPATMGISDPVLARLLQEFAGLQAEYFSNGVGDRNPLTGQLELRLKNTKKSIMETLQGIMLANEMANTENAKQISKLNSQAARLPEKERQLLGIERKFNLNNVLYTFLLQKRAEAQIQRASNKSDLELIDSARAGLFPIAPNILMIYMVAIFMSVMVPFVVLFFLSLIQNKITSDEDIRKITYLPIVGHIPRSRLSYNTVVLSESQSSIAEAFRSLRTRIEFITKEAKSPLILVSSSVSGEGKTFSAINLASAYSLSGKKTLLVGFDLRRPTLAKSF